VGAVVEQGWRDGRGHALGLRGLLVGELDVGRQQATVHLHLQPGQVDAGQRGHGARRRVADAEALLALRVEHDAGDRDGASRAARSGRARLVAEQERDPPTVHGHEVATGASGVTTQ
jgi:hypothetical protein